MFYDILLVFFLGCLIFVSAFLLKKLFPDDTSTADHAVPGIRSHETTAVAVDNAYPEPPGYEVQQPYRRKSPGKSFTNLVSLTVLAVCGWFIYENRSSLQGWLPAPAPAAQSHAGRVSISPGQVEGHALVDGINWIKIVATGTDGVPFEGWVSEMAIQNQPPKENKMADEMMKKLGLPTVRERAESLKKLQRVGSALNTALKDARPKEN